MEVLSVKKKRGREANCKISIFIFQRAFHLYCHIAVNCTEELMYK
jgi:hypothetical protein